MARTFNGSSDFIDCGGGTALSPASAITVLCWLKVPSFVDYQGIVIRSTLGGASAGDYNLYTRVTGAIAIYLNGVLVDPSTHAMTLGAWNSVGFTADGTALTAYVNGVASGTSSAQNFNTANASHFVVGNDYNVGGRFLNGSVAEVCVWNVVLTAGEIAAFNAGERGKKIRPNALVGYFTLDGLQSPEPDLSGFANNGSLTGTGFAPGPPINLFTPRWPASILPFTPPISVVVDIGTGSEILAQRNSDVYTSFEFLKGFRGDSTAQAEVLRNFRSDSVGLVEDLNVLKNDNISIAEMLAAGTSDAAVQLELLSTAVLVSRDIGIALESLSFVRDDNAYTLENLFLIKDDTFASLENLRGTKADLSNATESLFTSKNDTSGTLENLSTIRDDNQSMLEDLGTTSIQDDVLLPIEVGAALKRDSNTTFENLSLTKDDNIVSVEEVPSIRRDSNDTIEGLRLQQVDSQVVAEETGSVAVKNDAVLPVEGLAISKTDFDPLVENQSSIRNDADSGVELLRTQREDFLGQAESTGTTSIARQSLAQFEFAATLLADIRSQIETSANVRSDDSFTLETLTTIRRDLPYPLEDLLGIKSDVIVNLESTGSTLIVIQGAAQTEFLAALRIRQDLQSELLASIRLDISPKTESLLSLSLDSMSMQEFVRTIKVQYDTSSNLEWLGSLITSELADLETILHTTIMQGDSALNIEIIASIRTDINTPFEQIQSPIIAKILKALSKVTGQKIQVKIIGSD